MADVSNGTLFNAFPSKQVLIDTIYRDAKTAMFATSVNSGGAAFNRANLRANWDGYLAWAHANPNTREVMHLLLDAGLASDKAQTEVDALAAPHESWLQHALDQGIIRGPSVSFIGRLIFYHLDLVIIEQLNKSGEDLAFDMLCTSIGLDQ